MYIYLSYISRYLKIILGSSKILLLFKIIKDLSGNAITCVSQY